ncbi:Peptidase C1A [Trypanosoma melophagium]|uniref:Peptidase C1A n=1 Tax=Trypanosoma melophagium TaxID=715481 RepID=UPI00351A4EF1|nr:Peptidase C1A [Trypanosoma melophagium]
MCNNNTIKVARVKNYVSIPENDQDAHLEALVHQGPIAVGVYASNWDTYIQIVGYGHDDNLNADYCIVLNSWSPDWGENGYIRLLRTEKAECGWNVDAHDGSACDGDPDTDWACGMCGILYGSAYPVMQD